MGSMGRRKSVGWVVMGVLPLLIIGCAGKRTAEGDSRVQGSDESYFFFSAVEGRPLCLAVSIQKTLLPRLLTTDKTRWRVGSWVAFPGGARCLTTKKGKMKQAPTAPVQWIDDQLLFTSDKDRFVFYWPAGKNDELLLVTEPIFADRVRSGSGREIHYGRMSAEMHWDKRRIEGNLFYERRDLLGDSPHGAKRPPFGMEKGGRLFLIWVQDGECLYLEEGGGGGGEPIRLALMQDRRGRWQETNDAEWETPGCVFGAGPCPSGEAVFRFSVPLWSLQGALEVITGGVSGASEGAGEGEGEEEGLEEKGAAPGTRSFWTSLEAAPEAKKCPPLSFCAFKGMLEIEGDRRTAYGIGISTRSP